MTSEKTYFQEDWLQQDIYKDWLVPNAHAKTKAHYKKCKKSFELSNMGIQAVKSHAAGEKHQSATKPASCFFINGKELHAKPLGSDEKISTFFTKKQATIVSLIKSSLSTNAEIISTMSCYSNNSCANF
ncbi:uncharacterized protein LOC124818961 [Hydra vulgaris]|uniref:uncharacterized protein LOC124818961 n=1 Tax=Hydra vulgaris TaxID=6087 RepID=UPI001F5E44D7|nr:uncharacterized protein LOC124818961 isoform X2 [Hydra vulgaris]